MGIKKKSRKIKTRNRRLKRLLEAAERADRNGLSRTYIAEKWRKYREYKEKGR